MKTDELRDRLKFLLLQESIIMKKLNKYVEDVSKTIHKLEPVSDMIDESEIDLETYISYRCECFEEYSEEFINSYLNNIALSSTKIHKETIDNFLKVRYIFYVFRNRISPDGFKIVVLVNINTGEIVFNLDGESTERITEEFYNKLSIESTAESKFLKKKNVEIISRFNSRISENIQCSSLKPDSFSLYKHNFPSLEFLNMNFFVHNFPNLQTCFKKPFNIKISVSEMKKYLVIEKTNFIIKKLKELTLMTVSDLLFINSVEYFRNYGINELLCINDANEEKTDIFLIIKNFIDSIALEKKIPLLNFLLKICPGLILSLDFDQYRSYPYYYLIFWAENHKKILF